MKTKTLTIQNTIDEISRLPLFLEDVIHSYRIPLSDTNFLNLALEEAMVNSIQYAYPTETVGLISLSAMWDADNHLLQFTLTDQGTPFDPTAVPDADTTLPLDERPIGGLGIFLVRQIMDKIEYRYCDNNNQLIMSKYIE